jgi:hypothetical protein
VVIGQQVVESQVLDRFSDPANSAGISTEFDLWIYDTDLHGSTLLHGLISNNCSSGLAMACRATVEGVTPDRWA